MHVQVGQAVLWLRVGGNKDENVQHTSHALFWPLNFFLVSRNVPLCMSTADGGSMSWRINKRTCIRSG